MAREASRRGDRVEEPALARSEGPRVDLRAKVTGRAQYLEDLPVPANIGQALRLPPGSSAYRVCGVRHSEAGPFQHVTAWVPPSIGAALAEEDLSKTSLIASIERHLGMPIQSMEQTVEAALAPRHVAELLQLRPRSPLLLFERTYVVAKGEPVEHAISYQTSRRYPYRVVLSRTERRP